MSLLVALAYIKGCERGDNADQLRPSGRLSFQEEAQRMHFTCICHDQRSVFVVALRWVLLSLLLATTGSLGIGPVTWVGAERVVSNDSLQRLGVKSSLVARLVAMQPDALAEMLPTEADVPAGLELTEEGKRSLDEIAAGFPDPAEASALLTAWGFHGNVFRNFAVPEGSATPAGTVYLEISLHAFATAKDAAEALSYYAAGRAAVLGHAELSVEKVGEQTEAVGGPLNAGVDVTVYARTGSVLIRASALAMDGDPMPDALSGARAIVSATNRSQPSPRLTDLLPTEADVPAGLVMTQDAERTLEEVAVNYSDPAGAERRFTDWGWAGNVARSFEGSDQTGGITSIYVSLHRFGDADSTAQALEYSLADQAATTGATNIDVSSFGDRVQALALSYTDGNEVTVYAQQGTVLIRVTVVAMGRDAKPVAVRLARRVARNAEAGEAGTTDVRTDAGRPEAAGPGGCELVELYPGYPGYQGYVTGVDGVGDHACLRDLEARDPFFSRTDEDRENRAAGRRLGLAGDFDTWTWENWLAVEAERGMMPTCYACLIATADQRPEPRNTPVQRDDPRLLLGEFGADTVYRRYAAEHGIGLRGTTVGDYQLRAIAGSSNSGRHLNAIQLLEAYEAILDGWFTAGQFLNPEYLMCELSKQGGYFPIPENAAPEDQMFAVFLGVYSLELVVPPEFYRGYAEWFETLMRGWQLEIAQGGQQSFAKYLGGQGFGC